MNAINSLSADRIKGSISLNVPQEQNASLQDGNIKDTIKRVASDVYTTIDELNPLREMVEEVERITGEKVAFKDNHASVDLS